ncbi:hypothetical protein CRG98_005801, partial [Punica granatum]
PLLGLRFEVEVDHVLVPRVVQRLQRPFQHRAVPRRARNEVSEPGRGREGGDGERLQLGLDEDGAGSLAGSVEGEQPGAVGGGEGREEEEEEGADGADRDGQDPAALRRVVVLDVHVIALEPLHLDGDWDPPDVRERGSWAGSGNGAPELNGAPEGESAPATVRDRFGCEGDGEGKRSGTTEDCRRDGRVNFTATNVYVGGEHNEFQKTAFSISGRNVLPSRRQRKEPKRARSPSSTGSGSHGPAFTANRNEKELLLSSLLSCTPFAVAIPIKELKIAKTKMLKAFRSKRKGTTVAPIPPPKVRSLVTLKVADDLVFLELSLSSVKDRELG